MEALASLSVEIIINFVFKDLPHTVPKEFCLSHKGWLFSRIPVTFFHDFAEKIWYKVLCQVCLTDPTRDKGQEMGH